EAEGRVEYRSGVERKPRSVERLVELTTAGTVGSYVVAGRASARAVPGQAAMRKEASPERQLQRVGDRRLRHRRYRLFIRRRLRTRNLSLRCCTHCRADQQHRQTLWKQTPCKLRSRAPAGRR